jgi:outer membrane protein OmpA-like peptidoglycan-associated protein
MYRSILLFILGLFFSHNLLAQMPLEVSLSGKEYQTVAISPRSSSSFYMRVTDDMGASIEGITLDDVKVKQNGEDARVVQVTLLRETVAITKKVVLVLDNSTSMKESVEEMIESLDTFLNSLGRGVEVAVVMYEEKEEFLEKAPVIYDKENLKLSYLDFTSDFAKVRDFANLRFRRNLTRSTYLYDAAVVGISLFRGVPRYMQKAIVVMSDGEDTGSTFKLQKAIANYKEDIRVYSINFGQGAMDNRSLMAINEATGGRYIRVEKSVDLQKMFTDLSREITAVYLVVYKGVVSEESPFLRVVFFDHNSSEIPERYVRYANYEETLTFEESQSPNPLIHHRNILNVIGQRMQMHPWAGLTITGCNSNYEEEEGNLDLSKARAEAVKDYLVNVWRIAPTRLTVESRNLPEKASTSSVELGRAENRRVELQSSDAGILKPVLTNNVDMKIEGENMVTEIYSLNLFDFNSAEISEKNSAILEKVLSSYKSNANSNVSVVGYSDNIGKAEYNKQLAEKRASAVLAELKAAGVAEDRLISRGLGEAESPFSNTLPEGRFLNRTVRVFVSHPK